MREVRGYCWTYNGTGRIDIKFMLPFYEDASCRFAGFMASL